MLLCCMEILCFDKFFPVQLINVPTSLIFGYLCGVNVQSHPLLLALILKTSSSLWLCISNSSQYLLQILLQTMRNTLIKLLIYITKVGILKLGKQNSGNCLETHFLRSSFLLIQSWKSKNEVLYFSIVHRSPEWRTLALSKVLKYQCISILNM